MKQLTNVPNDSLSASKSKEQLEILAWLKTVQFKKVRFGGVDEADVWKKIEELNSLYEKALLAERARFEAAGRATSAEVNPSDE